VIPVTNARDKALCNLADGINYLKLIKSPAGIKGEMISFTTSSLTPFLPLFYPLCSFIFFPPSLIFSTLHLSSILEVLLEVV
jgi:hypothetical protein